MATRNASREIPLSNEDRYIIKTGIYRCCDKKWKAKLIQVEEDGRIKYVLNHSDLMRSRNVCNRCQRRVYPTIRDWNKRWYGHFRCMGILRRRQCGRTWTSSLTWTLNNQIQTTQCKSCNTETLPYQLVSCLIYIFVNFFSCSFLYNVIHVKYRTKRNFKDNLQRRESRDSEDAIDRSKPHPKELCSMCQRLGRPCIGLNYDNDTDDDLYNDDYDYYIDETEESDDDSDSDSNYENNVDDTYEYYYENYDQNSDDELSVAFDQMNLRQQYRF